MRVRVGLMTLLLSPGVLVACGHEDDDERAACPDVASSSAFAIGRGPDVDLDAVVEAIDCDGEVSEREARCLRSPWARVPDAEHYAAEIASSPEEAVRLTAGDATAITKVLSRSRDRARLEVELEGDPGAYDVLRLRSGWLVVSGEGCASGAASSDVDDEMGAECREAIDQATPDADGNAFVTCIGGE